MRGHSLKLIKPRSRLEIYKYFFKSRVINVWNSLTEKVVHAPSVIAFENSLGKLWSNHPLKYDPDNEYNPFMAIQDPGSWRIAETHQTDEELNTEAFSLRSEST